MTEKDAVAFAQAAARLLRARGLVAERRADMTTVLSHIFSNADVVVAVMACELEINGFREENPNG